MKFARIDIMGINQDISPIETNQGSSATWRNLDNMTPEPGKMKRATGYQWQWWIDNTPGAEVGALEAPLYLSYTPQLSQDYWIYAGATKICTIDAAWNHNEVTPVGGIVAAGANEWSGGNLNGIAVLNQPDNDPVYWSGGLANALALPGLRPGTRYNVMRPHKYHLIGMGVIDGTGAFEDAVQWSDAADPGQIPQTWVPEADNEAGDNVLADERGKIIDGASLRESFYIYKSNAVYEMSYVGGQEVYRFVKVFNSAGALTKNCIARVEGTHVVLGNGDVYQHDGQNIRSLVQGKVSSTIFGVIDDTYYDRSFVAYLESENKVWICFPQTGSEWPDVAVVWDPETDTFGVRDLTPLAAMAPGVVGDQDPGGSAQEWDIDSGEWDQDTTIWLQSTLASVEDSLAMADNANARFYVANTGTTAAGEPYLSRVITRGLDLGDPTVLKGVRRIYPRIKGQQGTQFTLTVYVEDTPDGSLRKVQTSPYVLGQEDGIAVNANGRYFGLDLRTEESVDWTISGVDFMHMPRGPF